MDNILGVKAEIYSKCNYCEKQDSIKLTVPYSIYCEWLILLRRYEHTEWGAVFNVVDNKVMDYTIPKQEVTSTSCEFKVNTYENGMIHSHHSMAFNGFSTQDHEQAIGLFEWNIVISNTGYNAVKKTKLPCGGFGFQDIKLEIEGYPELSFDNIQEKKTIVTPYKSSNPLEDFDYTSISKYLYDDDEYGDNYNYTPKNNIPKNDEILIDYDGIEIDPNRISYNEYGDVLIVNERGDDEPIPYECYICSEEMTFLDCKTCGKISKELRENLIKG